MSFLSTSCGSPNYAAPEVVSTKLYAEPEVDVWSCGVILYCFLCGSLRFAEDSLPALFREVKDGMYLMPNLIPAPCKGLIKQIVTPDPLQRISIAKIGGNEWFQESLPPYLQLMPYILASSEELVDQELLESVVCKLDVPHDIAHRALLKATNNDISVAYWVLLDSRRQKAPTKVQASPPREVTPQETKIVSPKSEASTPMAGSGPHPSPATHTSRLRQCIAVYGRHSVWGCWWSYQNATLH